MTLGSLSVTEKWMWDDDPDTMDHPWSNHCLNCKDENYTPFSSSLLHYCINCGIICQECGYPKPLFAFPYNKESQVYKQWSLSRKGRAPKQAHLGICNHCHGRELDKLEQAMKVEEENKRQALIKSPQAAAALKLMLGKR
jgi:5-methylcytosine-specific restriction endonuclease McrA